MNDAAVLRFSVGDPVWFHDTESPTDPDPAPGVVQQQTGDNSYRVEIALADGSTRTVKHVGAQEPAVDPEASPSVRWIELRELGGIEA